MQRPGLPVPFYKYGHQLMKMGQESGKDSIQKYCVHMNINMGKHVEK